MMEKTTTPGIYRVIGKKGKTRYRLFMSVPVSDENGSRWKSKVKTFSRYQAAIDYKVKVQGEIKSDKYIEPSDKTVGELIRAWIDAGKSRGVTKRGPWKIQTTLKLEGVLENHIGPALGDIKAASLKKLAIERAADQWTRTQSAKNANKILDALNGAYKWGLKNPDTFGVKQNPLDTVERRHDPIDLEELEHRALGTVADHGTDKPQAKRGTLRAIDPSEVYTVLEQRKIIEAAEPGFEKAFFMTAILTGLRHGELAALRWVNIDLKKRGVLTVNRSLTQLSKKHGGPRLEAPKTPHSYREIKLAKPLIAELTKWKLASPSRELVFTDALGHPTNRNSNNDKLKAICERAGVKTLSMHNLRHSYASTLLNNDPSKVLEVAYLMGHSSPAVTLAVYASWAKNEKSDSHNELARSILEAAEESVEAENIRNV
jgi:integrase